MWIDAHTHLEMLENNTADVIAEAKAQQVLNMITIGCHPNDFDKVCSIASQYYPIVSGTLGVHPHEAKFYNQDIENQIRSKSQESFIVGIGEIGLDYYYNHSDPEVQKKAFHSQMELAAELSLPVQIHSREAEADTLTEINLWKNKVVGMLHCFSGSAEMAKKALDCGYYISLSGVLTFKNAEDLRQTAKMVPLDRLLVETDAPFLTPVPHRGKKNQPAFVTHTAQLLAQLKGVDEATLSRQLKVNVQNLFKKWKF